MGIMHDILRLKSFVEGNLITYLLDRFSQLKNDTSFQLQKRVEVKAPFGNIKTRKAEGTSSIEPEICITSQSLCLCAEAVAWDDDNSSADTKRSEAHGAMSKIGLPKSSVYFAQKVMCQVFPAYLHCKKSSKFCFAFFSFTENHKEKIISVLNQLKNKGFVQEFVRPLEHDQTDINKYYQIIYEVRFPEATGKIEHNLNSH